MEPTDIRNPRDFWICDTRTPDTATFGKENLGRNWAEWDLTANPEYKSMVGLRGDKLKKAMSESGVELGLRGCPENFHAISHLTPEVAKYYTEKGFVWIHKDFPDDAKRVMLALRRLDANVNWHPMGMSMTEEELKEGQVSVGMAVGGVRSMIPGVAPTSVFNVQAAPSKLMGGK